MTNEEIEAKYKHLLSHYKHADKIEDQLSNVADDSIGTGAVMLDEQTIPSCDAVDVLIYIREQQIDDVADEIGEMQSEIEALQDCIAEAEEDRGDWQASLDRWSAAAA